MKKIICIIFLCSFLTIWKTIGQKADTIAPVISLTEEVIKSKFSDCYIELLKDDSIKISIACIYSFPDEYLEIPEPTIKDEIDSSPKIETKVTIDSAKKTVIKIWKVTDASGNVSKLSVIVVYNGIEYQLFLYSINVNDNYKILDLINNFYKQDTVYFCKNSDVKLTIDSYWSCAMSKKEFYWKVNNKSVYNKDELQLNLSLDTLPTLFTVEAEANVSNNNLGNSGLSDNKVQFIIKQLPGAKVEVTNPSCKTSADGSIFITGAGNVKWDNNSTQITRNNLNPGNYSVSYTKDTCVIHETIVLKSNKILSFDISDTILNISNKNYISITNNSTINGDYLWKIGDSIFNGNEKNFDFNIKDTGKISVSLSLKDNICKDINTRNLTIIKDHNLGVISSKSCDLPINIIIMNNTLFLKNQIFGEFTVSIYSLEGKLIYTINQLNVNETVISLNKFHSGVYLIKIATNTNRSISRIFIP